MTHIRKKLSCGNWTIVDKEDERLLCAYKWYVHSGNWRTKYVSVLEPGSGKRLYLHRIISNAPNGVFVDHKNGDGLDNRRENLRLCTHSQNMHNIQQGRGISKYKGVSFYKRGRQWRAYISINYKQKHLGYFDNEKDAAIAYDRAAKAAWGLFAKLNFARDNI